MVCNGGISYALIPGRAVERRACSPHRGSETWQGRGAEGGPQCTRPAEPAPASSAVCGRPYSKRSGRPGRACSWMRTFHAGPVRTCLCQEEHVAGQDWSTRERPDRRRRRGLIPVRKRHTARGHESGRRPEPVDLIRMLLLVAVGAHLNQSAAAPQPLPPSNLEASHFQYTSLNTSWVGPISGEAASYDLRWRVVGAHDWAAGQEMQASDSSLLITGLTAGNQYEFAIQSRNSYGDYSILERAFGETISDERATNVRAVNVNQKQIDLAWEPARDSSLLGQQVFVSYDDGNTWNYNAVASQGPMLGPAASSHTVNFLSPMVTYLFRVDSIFLGHLGVTTSVSSRPATTLPAAPSKVVGLMIFDLEPTNATLRWEPLIGTAEMGALSVIYFVDVAEVDASSATPDTYIVRDANNLQVSNLLRNVEYFFTVTAQNDQGKTSPVSDQAFFTTNGERAAEMEAPMVTRTTDGLMLSWKHPVTNADTGGLPVTSFVVYSKRQDEVVFDAGVEVGNVISYEVVGLFPNFFYEFAVAGINAAGTGLRGVSSVRAMPPTPPDMAAPTVRIHDNGNRSDIEVSWAAPSLAENVLNYRVFLRQIVPFTAMDNGSVVPSAARSYRFSNLPDGTRFEIKIAAETFSGLSQLSSGVFAETYSDTVPTAVSANMSITGLTTCLVNVTWTKPRFQATNFRVFATIEGVEGADAWLTYSTDNLFTVPECARGAVYTYYVQAIFAGGSGESLSLPSPILDVPVSPPTKMAAPTLALDPANPSTSIIVTWIPPVVISAGPKSAITSFNLTVTSSYDPIGVLSIPAPATTYVLTGLDKKTTYRFRIQALNSLGASVESERSSIITAQTVPGPIVNLIVVPGSESPVGDELTLSWAVEDWGESDHKIQGLPAPYPYCPETQPANTHCQDRRYFKVTPFRVGDDYAEPTFVFGDSLSYVVTGLSGGVDYKFTAVAINTGGLESETPVSLRYRTVSVVPRQIKSLNVYTPENNDIGNMLKVGLEWVIPLDAETTGGMTLSGFRLRSARLTACENCMDTSAACIAQRNQLPWVNASTVSGQTDAYEFMALKGQTYVFNIAAINGIGEGPYWPSCTVGAVNCHGTPNGQIPYTCFSAVFTVPSPIPNFGDWAENTAGVQPSGAENFQIQWGRVVTEGDPPTKNFDYNDAQTNGGRAIQMIEIQRSTKSRKKWPVDFYCPTLPSVEEGELPVCLYQLGCTPEPCIASCPICVDSQFTSTSFESKRVTDFLVGETPDQAETYIFRIRFSNVGINDCASRPSSDGSSPRCDWSDWSDEQSIQLARSGQFHNLFTKVDSPTEISILWFTPVATSGTLNTEDIGDTVDVYYGPTVASVSISPFTSGNWTRGPARGPGYNQWVVNKLVPASTYYFSVVGFHETSSPQTKESTRSAVTQPVTTAVGKPARVQNISASIPDSQADIQAGGLKIDWIALSAVCAEGTGLILEDGSVDNCERGEGVALLAYKIYFRKSSGAADDWSYVLAPSTTQNWVITGLEKEVSYKFRISAVNSELEGSPSVEVEKAPIATIPGSPPPPLSTGASTTSVRIAWQEPDDLGTKQVLQTKFRLTIIPRRDGQPGNETITFTWEREYVVNDLNANSLYLFSVAYQATPMLGFGFSSDTSYVYTTPLPPVNLRLSDGKNITESTKVLVKWDWTGVVNGNVTITGYRLSFFTSDRTSTGQTYCSGGSVPVDGVGVAECVLAGLENGKVYQIVMSASNDPRLETNFGPDSEEMILQTKAALPTVVDIHFSEISTYSTKIHWTTFDGGLSIEGFDLRIRRESDQFGPRQAMSGVVIQPIVGGSVVTYEVTGLGANLYYSFVIIATNALGFQPSETSDPIRTKPAAVSTPTVSFLSSNSVNITWSSWYGTNEIKQYSIQTRMNEGAGEIGPWFASGTVDIRDVDQLPGFQVQNLMANTGYEVRVAAMNLAGTGEYGESVHVTTLAEAPRFVYVTRIGQGEVDLRWSPKPGATPQYTVIPSRWVPAHTQTVNGVTISIPNGWVEEDPREKFEGYIDFFHVSGLVKGARYKFQVASSSVLGVGARSVFSHEVTTMSSIPEPGPKPTLSSPSVDGLVVSWTEVASNELNGGSPTTEYVLYSYSHAYGGQGWKLAARVAPGTTTYVAVALEPDVNYQFKVAVVNANGQGPPGPASEKMPTVPGQLEAPFQQSFLKTILLTWTPPANNSFTAYRIYSAEKKPESEAEGAVSLEDLWEDWSSQIISATTTLMKFDGLKADKPYRFKMAARNPSGWGADSDVVESRTTIVSDPWSMTDDNEVALTIGSIEEDTTNAQLAWRGPATTDAALRGSAIGYRVTACAVATLICDTGEDYLQYCETDPPNIYTRSHECDITKNDYIRPGLLKNTMYYLQLSIVNSGGEGPRSKPSPEFRTSASYPVQMSRPVATTNSRDSITVAWEAVTDWNSRGGLDLTGYVLFKQMDGQDFDAGEVVYEGTSFTYINLPSNTKFQFSVIAENTWCSICRTDIQVLNCYFEPCCDTHTCSPKSLSSSAVSTIPGKMTLPRLKAATIFDITVTWDVLPGTPDNIFEYTLRFRDVDRPDKDDSGGWFTITFAGRDSVGVGVKEFELVGGGGGHQMEPNNRYEVILNADNGFGYGGESESAILMTKADKVSSVEIVAVRSTEVTLVWQSPPGRRLNIDGYSIAYRVATESEEILQKVVEDLPLSYTTSVGPEPRFDVAGLQSNTSYIFAVAAINGAGVGEFSDFTKPHKTMILDMLGACYFYQVSEDGDGVSGNFILQQKAAGTATLRGAIKGLEPSAQYSLRSWQYGKTNSDHEGIVIPVVDFTASNDAITQGEYMMSALETSLGLTGPNSAITSSLRLYRDGSLLSQCEMGLAKPRSGAEENAAKPPIMGGDPPGRAFCRLVPLSGVDLSGGFIASPTHKGIRVRGRVCGISKLSAQFSVHLHEFGDIQGGNYDDVGDSINHLGTMYIDNLESANFDLVDAIDVGLSTSPGLVNIMGRSIVLYNQTYEASASLNPSKTAIAACVLGAAEPSIDTTVYQVEALPPVCTPCTWLMGLQESMFTVAELFKTDWISVWSLNSVNNPDRDTAGTSVYYAHPYVMRSGETMASVRHRFAITDEHIGLLNNKKTVFVPGETICIVPMWKKAVDSNGAYVCDATADRMRIAGNLDVLNMSDSTGSSAGLSEMEAQAGKVSYVVT